MGASQFVWHHNLCGTGFQPVDCRSRLWLPLRWLGGPPLQSRWCENPFSHLHLPESIPALRHRWGTGWHGQAQRGHDTIVVEEHAHAFGLGLPPSLVRVAWRYRWSSAAVHVSEHGDDVELLDLRWRTREWDALRWCQALCDPDDDAFVSRLRRRTHTGRPLATDSWLSKLEKKLGQRLRPLPVGRPRKRSSNSPKQVRRSKMVTSPNYPNYQLSSNYPMSRS